MLHVLEDIPSWVTAQIPKEVTARLIAERTKSALSERKRRGAALSNPVNARDAAARGRRVQEVEADRFAANVLPLFEAIRATRVTSLRDLANAPNTRGIPTARGRQWQVSNVRNVLRPQREHCNSSTAHR